MITKNIEYYAYQTVTVHSKRFDVQDGTTKTVLT